MSFKLVYYSQQDPQWKADLLGFGDPGDTIGMYGCALTSVAMLVSGHGYTETPKTLNQKLKSHNGFVSSGIRWDVVSQVHSQITLRENISCEYADAPLAKINAALDAGQPVVVRVDSSPAPGLQWHYVLLYARKGSDDYLMLDPYPYSPGTTKEDSLMARYSRGNPLKRAIQQVLIYQCSTSGGPISLPSSETTDTPPTQPTTDSVGDGPRARVKLELVWGLNIRSSPDTSSTANIVVSVPAGTELALLDADGLSKIGTQQWVRVRTSNGKEGYAAAWYLDKVPGATPAPSTGSTSSGNEAPPSTPTTPAEIQVRVLDSVTAGLRIRTSTDTSSMANIITTVPAGTVLTLVNASDESKIGGNGQWVRVRTAQGQEGMTAAWYLEKVASPAPAPSTGSTSSGSEAPSSTPASTPAVPSQPMDPNKKYLMVSEAAGASGIELRKTASNSAPSQMHLTPGMLLIVIEPYSKATGKLGQQNQWIYVRGPGSDKKLGYVLSQFVKLP